MEPTFQRNGQSSLAVSTFSALALSFAIGTSLGLVLADRAYLPAAQLLGTIGLLVLFVSIVIRAVKIMARMQRAQERYRVPSTIVAGLWEPQQSPLDRVTVPADEPGMPCPVPTIGVPLRSLMFGESPGLILIVRAGYARAFCAEVAASTHGAVDLAGWRVNFVHNQNLISPADAAEVLRLYATAIEEDSMADD